MINKRGIRILVLSSIHPMQIAELIGFFSRYENINAHSVQSFALLGEETLNKKYIPYNYTLATALKNKPEIILPTDTTPLIVYGNLDKNTPIEFDYKIKLTTQYSANSFDDYLAGAEAIMKGVYREIDKPSVTWYTDEDCELELPTLHHLQVFLKTLGIVEKQEEQDGV